MGGSLTSEMSPNVRFSHLLQLKEQGSFAEGVVGVYPSVTYPSHTTIVTGRLQTVKSGKEAYNSL